ncbi:MAG: hypothetical protein RL732_1138 [Bacteroidota bacterium]
MGEDPPPLLIIADFNLPHMYQTLLSSLEEGILTVTINRPEKLNALNARVLLELDQVLNEVERNEAVRSVIFTGAGPKAFVAGADIAEFNALDKNGAMELARKGQELFFRIEKNTKPIVAAVNGFALGGGCELAMSCHFRVAVDTARFGQPEVNLGLIPGYGGTQRLVHLVGKGRALELLLSGSMIDATEAHRIGLVNHLTSAEQLLPRTRELLTVINAKAPIALQGCIRAANNAFESNGMGYAIEVEAFGHAFDTADRVEGTTAFLEKRAPRFSGK